MTIKCNDIINHIESFCPRELALDWDNVGLIIGDRNQSINKVLIALDAIESVIDEAINEGVDMIITHHPLFIPKFSKPINSITTDSHLGKLIYKLIKANISLYCAHTNLDIVKNGINDVLANLLELQNVKPLEITGFNKLKKIVVFVPYDHVENVREQMASAGAGWIGNYSDCSYMTEGIGTFKPLKGSTPHLGSTNVLEKVKEYRIETVVKEEYQKKVIAAMLSAHPYEEVAYDIYPLENKDKYYGIGRFGELKEKVGLSKLINQIKHVLDIDSIRLVGNIDSDVQKVAICSGSGISALESAVKNGADVFITGDVKFHEAQSANEYGINIIDAGHYATEKIIIPVLREHIEGLGNIEVIESKINGETFKTI